MTLFPELLCDEPPEGLVYQPNFVSMFEEATLLEFIESQPWDTEYQRRRQFYGESYRNPGHSTPYPPILADLGLRLHCEGLILVPPGHSLINEYLPGQGIAAHVDELPDERGQVVTVSLLDSYPMEFVELGTGRKFEQWLERRSVAILSGPSRTHWTHEILKRKADAIAGGGRRNRARRISITYRTKMGSGLS